MRYENKNKNELQKEKKSKYIMNKNNIIGIFYTTNYMTIQSIKQ